MKKRPSRELAALLVGGWIIASVAGPMGSGLRAEPQQSAAPARDNANTRRGTGRIRGRVVSAEMGTPLRRATVNLTVPAGDQFMAGRMSGGDQPGTVVFQAQGNGTYGAISNYSTTASNDRLVATDGEGRFEFTDLPAGRYTLGASKGGYVGLMYGERRQFEGGRPIDLADGQILDEVNFTLPQGGVINARVTDEFGEPINGITVEAQQFRYSGGERKLTTVSGASFIGLNVTNEAGEQRIHGLQPGDYYVVVGQGVDSRFVLAGGGRVYIATYYPQTTDASQAQVVKLGAGQEVNVSIVMGISRISRISGKVVHADGTQWVPRNLTIRRDVGDSFTSATVAFLADGTFQMPRFVPGDYWLEVLEPAPGGTGLAFARQPLHLTGEDATDLVVATKPIQTISGRIVFETGTPPTGLRPAAIHLHTTLAVPGSGRNGTANVLEGWGFGLPGVVGTGVIRLTDSSSGWYLKAVTLDGQDITDRPVDFETIGGNRDLQVVLTQKNGVVTGGVVNAANAPVAEYAVVLFPADQSEWNARTRFTGLGRPDQAGHYTISGLPPGRYLAVAVDSIEMGEDRAPDFFKRVIDRATPFTIGEGQSQSLNLRLIDK